MSSYLQDSFLLHSSSSSYIHIMFKNVNMYVGHTISFQTFFVWALLLIVRTWNSSPFRSNLFRLQCICCTVPTTHEGPHGSPLVWACKWPSSQPLSSSQLSQNDDRTKSLREQGLDYRDSEELYWCPSWSNSVWQGWSCGLVHCPSGPDLKSAGLFLRNLFLNSLKTST